jgi:magnesium transporter
LDAKSTTESPNDLCCGRIVSLEGWQAERTPNPAMIALPSLSDAVDEIITGFWASLLWILSYFTETWIIGAALTIVGSVVINFGTNVMKFGHLRGKRIIWIIGFVCFAVGNVLNFVAFSFAAQSLLAALGSVQFVSNVLFASSLLGERITPRTLIGTGVVVLGNIITVLFASHSTTIFDSSALLGLYIEIPFLMYLGASYYFDAMLQWTYWLVEFAFRTQSARDKLTVGSHSLQVRLMAFCYSAVSASLGAFSVTAAKSVSQLLTATFIHGHNEIFSPLLYLLLGAWLGLTVFWLWRLNKAIRKFEALLIIPMLQVCWTVFSVCGGGIYFHEFDSFGLVQGAGFVMGISVILSGVWILATTRSQLRDEQDSQGKESGGDISENEAQPLIGQNSAEGREASVRYKQYSQVAGGSFLFGTAAQILAPPPLIASDVENEVMSFLYRVSHQSSQRSESRSESEVPVATM